MKNPNATHSYYITKKTEKFLIFIDYDVDQNGVYYIKKQSWGYSEEQIFPIIAKLPQEVERKLMDMTKEEIIRVEIELKPLQFCEISKEELIED